MVLGIDDAIASGLNIIGKFIPDKDLQAKAEAEFRTAVLQADTQLAIAQTKVNQIEAASDDLYTKRARPTALYACTAGFVYQYILQPFLILLIKASGHDIILPNLDMTAIGTVLLGLSGLRTWDKYTATKYK